MFVTFILENIWSVYNAFNGKDANQAAQIRVINAIDKNIKFDKFKESYERFTIVMRKWLSISDTLLRMVVEQLDSPQNLSNRRIENLLSSSLIKFKDLPESSKQIKEHFERCSNSEDSPVIVFVSKMVHFDDQDVVKITNDCPSDQERFLAFSRIFSGTVKIGQELYVLTPKYVPGQNVIADLDPNVYSFTVNKLFMLMGRDLISVTSVPSGNIFGISGLDGLIFKSGTLSSTLDSPPFTPLKFEVHTIMSVVVEPESLADYDKLVKALTTLAASDPILECAQSEKGEHLLNVVGEVHLIKCTKDLQRLMGESKLTFSKPTVQLRETVSHNLPAIIYPQPLYIKSFTDLSEVQISGSADSSSFSMLDDCFNLKIHVDYITDELIEFLEANQNILDDECNKELDPYICADLKFLLDSQTHLPVKKPVSECLLCFSQGLMTNILLCDCDFDFISWFDCKKCSRSILDDSLCRGLQLVCKKGPLMSEKMTGVCFVIQEIQFKAIDDNHDTRNNYKLVGLARQCFYASLVNSYRLRCSVPVYQCIIMIGKKFLKIVYGLLKKRFAKILSETCVEGTSIFTIISNILAPEILGMYEEARCQTSGTVQIQFTFSHWENIETDPLFDESTSDQFDIHQKLRVPFKTVQDYVLSTRKAKGFSVDEKLIQDSEKQRTMKRNK
ncbi:Ribosome assembly protein 1 [Thelohanellus kitauei]|uniref:Ribosome assembly protein 1 n=1 Tax=Thelohanellus kitauei TaxID=669202 RepID=A0A0C2N4D4_THEKT|nr:Ribosome assembly protein 1 [Thelohanellus kitauei]